MPCRMCWRSFLVQTARHQSQSPLLQIVAVGSTAVSKLVHLVKRMCRASPLGSIIDHKGIPSSGQCVQCSWLWKSKA